MAQAEFTLDGKPFSLARPIPEGARKVMAYLDSLKPNELKTEEEVAVGSGVSANYLRSGSIMRGAMQEYRAVVHKQRVYGSKRAIAELTKRIAGVSQ